MSEEKLLAAGAEVVCGDMILDRKTVGRYRHGNFYPTDEGTQLLEAMDAANEGAVEVVEVVEKVSRTVKSARSAKAAKAVEVVAEVVAEVKPEDDLTGDLDALLGGDQA